MALSCVLTCRAQSEAHNATCEMGWRRALRREPFRGEIVWSRKSRGTNFTKLWNVSRLMRGDAESPGQCLPPFRRTVAVASS